MNDAPTKTENMTLSSEASQPGAEKVLAGAENALAAAGILGALAAASCCILPLALFSVGVSGAWIGNFTQLAPYQPYIIVVTLVSLGAGYWFVYRAKTKACAPGDACTRPLPNRLVMSGLIGATVLVVAAIAFNFLAPLFL